MNPHPDGSDGDRLLRKKINTAKAERKALDV